MISVILPTIHPGGMDFVVESFGKNPRNWDYELIVVDEYPGRVERGLAKKYLERNGVKVGWYGPAKEKSIPLTLCGWCNAVNTGLIHARGDYVIVMQDYVTLTSDWYIRWELVIAD